jgi:transcriptional regulator with XRE-family HTH domain
MLQSASGRAIDRLDFIHYIGYSSHILERPKHSINDQIARQIFRLRTRRKLSLQALAKRSGVSRSMISLIERAEASATAVVLARLATALGVPLAELFDAPSDDPNSAAPFVRRRHQAEWRDPASGYLRRNVSPGQVASPFRIVEVEFPAGGRVAFETKAHELPLHQQIWVLAGSIQVTLGEQLHRLARGDCLAMHLDRPIVFANPGRKAARYAVVIGDTLAARLSKTLR